MRKNKSELQLRERLDATGGGKSKNEAVQATRVLRDNELDAVNGGYTIILRDCLISSY